MRPILLVLAPVALMAAPVVRTLRLFLGPVAKLLVLLAEREVGSVALDGTPVTVEGVVRNGEIRRLAMVCCAADARPLTLRLTGDLPVDGTWVRATGRLAARPGGLILDTGRVSPIPTPPDPFL